VLGWAECCDVMCVAVWSKTVCTGLMTRLTHTMNMIVESCGWAVEGCSALHAFCNRHQPGTNEAYIGVTGHRLEQLNGNCQLLHTQQPRNTFALLQRTLMYGIHQGLRDSCYIPLASMMDHKLLHYPCILTGWAPGLLDATSHRGCLLALVLVSGTTF
jgi:hypothetical protein